jgi:hypothetical protein
LLLAIIKHLIFKLKKNMRMKKITILSFILLFCASIFAQTTVISTGKTTKTVIPKAAKPLLNTEKAIIWQDDFSTPANWTIAHGTGTTGDWVIGTAIPSGSYPIGGIASTTAANGFALFDSDLICSGNQIGNVSTATSHSCTGHAAVALTFQQYYERWYDSTFVYVSNNGSTWTKFSVNSTLAPNGSTANPATTSVNISSVAANQATVWIRFTFYSPSALGANAGCGYAWMVDDVKLIDLVPNDITANKSFFDLDGSGYYEIIPFSQMGIIKYGEDVMNNGSATQTNVNLNVNINAGTITSTGTPLSSLAASVHDTIWAQPAITTPGVFTGYAAHLNVSQTQTDANLADNVGDSVFFYADPTYFARTDNPTVYLDPYSFGTQVTASTGMEYGATYQFKNAAQIDSIGVSIYLATPGTSIFGKLYTVSGTTHTLVAQTAPYTLVPANLPAFIRLPLLTPYSVVAGITHLCATVSMTIPTLTTDTVAVLADGSFFGDAMVGGAAYLLVSGTWGWYTVTSTVPMVDLILHDVTIGIDENDKSGNFNMYPNPANDVLNIVSDNNIISVKVTNTIGQLVASEVADSKNLTIDTSELLTGVYFVQVQTSEGTYTRKINIR